MTRTHTRPALSVTRDPDGGLTVHDPQSDLVLSIIATHPAASGPRGVFVEVYAYNGGDVLASEVPQRGDDMAEPVRFRIAHHPTMVYCPQNKENADR